MQKELRVGLLTLGFILVIGGLLVWIKGNPFEPFKILRVRFENVHGINKGSKVEYAGLPCGKVIDFEITPNGILAVLKISKPDLKIYLSDKFIIVPSSTIASEYEIFVIPGKRPSPEIPENASIIGQSTPGIQDFLFAAEESLKNIQSIMFQIQGILGKLDKSMDNLTPLVDRVGLVAKDGTLDRILDDIESTSGSIKQASGEINSLVRTSKPRLQGGINAFSNASQRIDRELSGTAEGDISRFVQNASATSENFKNITGAIDPQTIKRLSTQASEFIGKLEGDGTEPGAPEMLKNTLGRIDRISNGLERSLQRKTVFGTVFSRLQLDPPSVQTPAKKEAPTQMKEGLWQSAPKP